MSSNYVIIGQDPVSKDFWFHERVDNNGQPGKVILMGDGRGDIKGTVDHYVEKGFDPSKIIINGQPATDVFQKSSDKAENTAKPAEVPEVTTFQALFKRLDDDQIAAINSSGQLPENLKFVQSPAGGYTLNYNLSKYQYGTRELPAGFEIKKDVLGFARVLPKGTEGLTIAK